MSFVKPLRVLEKCAEEHYLLLNHGKMHGITFFMAQCLHVLTVERCRISGKHAVISGFSFAMKLINCADRKWKPRDQSQLVKTDPGRKNCHFMDHKLHKLHKQPDTGLICTLKHITSFEVSA